MGKSILVTGGSGFIGSNFIRYMLKKYPDYKILNLDALTYSGNKNNLIDFENDSRYVLVHGDICDAELVNTVIPKVDWIVHFAAESHVDRSILNPEVFINTNVLGTQTLLNAAKKYSIQRFIHVSTDEVYGELDNTGLFTELTPIAPNSPYSASKASSDLLVRAYHRTYNLPCIITRCSNNYGPFQYPEKLIPNFIIQALANKPLPLYGDGLNVRDWLYVEDHCLALDLVLHKGRVGEIYNVGGNNERTNLYITHMILQELGRSVSLINHVKDRLGHDRRYAIDSTKIRDELGWKPQHSFDEAMRETIRWYVQNRCWWEGLLGPITYNVEMKSQA